MDKTQGIGSRQAFRVDCDNEVSLRCDPEDCRLLIITEKGAEYRVFKDNLIVEAIGSDKCRSKTDSRSPIKDKYVLLSGFAIIDGERREKKFIIRDQDVQSKKLEIVGLICSCNAQYLDTCAVPFVNSVVIVQNAGGLYDVFVYVSCDNARLVDSVNVIFEDPFDGPPPIETEVNCTFLQQQGNVSVFKYTDFEFEPGDPNGVTYLVLTDMLDTQPVPVGQQQEFEVVVQGA